MKPAPCHCGLPAPYSLCCARWHTPSGWLQAPTPEALMRSRYSAYVLGLAHYLLETWHPDTRPAVIEPDPPGLRWLGLSVRQTRLLDPDHATVEFVARCKLGSRAQRLHEISRFEKVSGQLRYVDGDIVGAPADPPTDP